MDVRSDRNIARELEGPFSRSTSSLYDKILLDGFGGQTGNGDVGALGKPDFRRHIEKAFQMLDELAESPGFARTFEILFHYVLNVYDIPKKDLMDLAIHSIRREDVREKAMTTYEQIKQEGRVEAGAGILARLLAKRFGIDPEPLMSLLSDLSFEQHEQLSEKILEAESMDHHDQPGMPSSRPGTVPRNNFRLSLAQWHNFARSFLSYLK